MNTLDTSGMVNIHGQPRMPSKAAIDPTPKQKREPPAEYHKGWRVVGIPPGELEAARAAHIRARLDKAFDQDAWAQRFKKKPVRSKAYSLPQAAAECKALAERCGWLHVDVVALTKSA